MLGESHSMTEENEEEPRPLNVKDALGYLDQVKAKFASQPDIYNRFLDIMKDFKTQLIDTPGVIERVSSLFTGNPNLITGFNTFLPPGYSIECSTDKQERNIIKVITPSGTTTISDSESLDLRQDVTEPKDPGPLEINHAIAYVHKIKNYFADQPEIYKEFLEILQTYQKGGKPIHKVYEQVKILLSGSTELLDEFKQFLPELRRRKKRLGNILPLSISKKLKRNHHPTEEIETSDVRSLASNRPQEMDYAWPTSSSEEAQFFDKAKRLIDNRVTYHAFLKVVDLFNQKSLDRDTLISRVESFIGSDPELFDSFKTLVGYENRMTASVDRTPENCGPTYRYTPTLWQNNKCSGRDALCWDVLNDIYVSHPTCPNDLQTSVSCKKNQHEEALYRVEEERYDYDLNIEANLNTIALLEPIAKKLRLMTAEEKANFRFPPDLLGSNKTVFHRVIKKIYGAQKGHDMIKLLHTNSSQAVSIVLTRLKQKDNEWKRAQREWHKIWREVEAKNYWKSLDHQGLRFKLSDRKARTTRSFISEAEQLERFEFDFSDRSIFKDVSRLVYFFLERQPVYNSEDCEVMSRFIKTIIPMMFDVQDVEPSIVAVDDIGLEEADDDEFDDKSVHSLNSLHSKRAKKGKRTRRNRYAGLLKNVLMRNTSKIHSSDEDEDADDEEEHDQAKSEASSDDQNREKEDEEEETEEEDVEDEVKEEERDVLAEPENSKVHHFFSDDTFYCFFRLYQVLYDRLHYMKMLDADFKKNPSKSKIACQEALDLGITPRRFKALKMDTKKGYYNVLLVLIDKLMEGEVDQLTFEESVRYIFGSSAYILFTIDKLVLSLVRHTHIIITDTHSQGLFEVFKTEHRAEQMGQGDNMAYKTNILNMLDPEDNVYHITFKVKSRTLNIQLLDSNKHLRRRRMTETEYNEYTTNYVNWAKETEGIDQSLLKPVFLKKNLQYKIQRTKKTASYSGLQYKICKDTYHMFYITGTEDIFIRQPTEKHTNALEMNNRWKLWLAKHNQPNTEEQARKLYS